jgi:hypothetical protein
LGEWDKWALFLLFVFPVWFGRGWGVFEFDLAFHVADFYFLNYNGNPKQTFCMDIGIGWMDYKLTMYG